MRRTSAGFTLIEALVGVAILGILLAMGLPAFSNAMENSRLRASASAFHAAAQFARSEAIKRNSSVEVILTTAAPTAGNKDTVALVSTLTGPNWIVRAQDPGAATFTFLQGRAGHEGGSNATIVVTGSNAAGAATKVAFDGMGGTNPAGAVTFSFASTSGACANASGVGPIRCLDVRVSTTGQTRLCDPTIITAGDSRGCN